VLVGETTAGDDVRENPVYRYEELAAFITGLVDSGTLMAGARVPLRGRSPEHLAAEIFAAFLRALHVRQGPGMPLVPMET